MVPIICLRNGDGPTVLFTGANHGDEYEEPVSIAARRAGLLICRRGQGHARHGDTLAAAADFAPD